MVGFVAMVIPLLVAATIFGAAQIVGGVVYMVGLTLEIGLHTHAIDQQLR